MANEKIIELKKQEVTKLAERFKKANIILLTDYRGINAEDVTKLRKDLGNSFKRRITIKTCWSIAC